MARLLQRLGAFSVRRRRTVLASWLVALAVLAALSLSFAGEFTGNFCIDDVVLHEAGVRDFDRYSVVPGTKNLQPDFFVPENLPKVD